MNSVLFAVLSVAVIGLIAGLVLSVASVVMAVKSDETVEKIRACLPGANCGACGFSGCDGYAEALAKGEAAPGLCAPGGAELNRKLGEMLGVETAETQPKTASVFCNGTCDRVGSKMHYHGIMSCAAASTLYSGPSDCTFGCIGLGDCVKACKFGAIKVRNGRAVVDTDKCTACTACVGVCPKGIIGMIPKKPQAKIACSNRDKGAVTRKLCTVGCIGCGKCVKTCEVGAITLENNLAEIAPDKCIACGKCIEVCPVGCISAENA